jgi:hypothetical protein
MNATLTADEVDRDDVLMVQAGRRPRLVLEALQVPRVHGRRERQHLQGHPPPQGELLRLVDHAHAAAAHLADDAEIAQGLRRRNVVACGHPCNSAGACGWLAQLGPGSVDEVQTLQAHRQRARHLRIAGQEGVPVRPLPGLEQLQVLFHGLEDPRVIQAGARPRVRRGIRRSCGCLQQAAGLSVVRHGDSSASNPVRIARSRAMPRTPRRRIRLAFFLRRRRCTPQPLKVP